MRDQATLGIGSEGDLEAGPKPAAIPESGRSNRQISEILRGYFRPVAAIPTRLCRGV